MTGLVVQVLGPLRVSRAGRDLAVPGARLEALVVRLALAGGRPVDPGVLVDAIWPDDPPAGPVHALQSLVTRLRRALGDTGAVEQVAGGYRLAVEPADVDAVRFEQLATAGRERLHAGEPEDAGDLLGEAVALWGDRPEAEPATVAAVAPAVATRLRGGAVEAVVDLAEARLTLGRPGDAASLLTTLLTGNPIHERAAALAMDALAAQGRQGEALALYERVRAALADGLGVDPGSALRDRHLALLRGEPPAARPAPDPGGARPPELPVPVTGFVGRDDELARIDALLDDGRLVTVLGPGGAGKTRTALEGARRRGYRDGVRLVDLAPVVASGEVGAAVLAVVGRRVADGRTPVDGDLADVVADRIGGRELLLVLDNCEQVIDAVARLVATVLARCPGARVLATSREPLAIDGEALVPLGPLGLPGPDDDVEQVGRAAAVRLFLQRAAAVRPGFELDATTAPDVVRVVRGLDGLPLALELAAARLRTSSLPELAAGLSDRFRMLTTGSRTASPRHRTLRAVIAWSWDLLDERERTLADRVAVLPGGITTGSATALCPDLPAGDVPDLLAGLVDRSVLQLGTRAGRFRMLESLREFGIDRLDAAGELDAVRDRAAEHVAGLLARSDAELRGPGQRTALDLVGDEYDNALAALRLRCETGDAAAALSLALDLTWYWHMTGRQADAARWLGEVLDVPGGASTPGRDCVRVIQEFNRIDTTGAEPPGRAAASWDELAARLHGYPSLPCPHSVLAAGALAFLGQRQRSLAIIDRLAGADDVWEAGLARLYRAELAENDGELSRMRPDLEAALECFGRAGDRWAQAGALPMRAQLRQYDGDLAGAMRDVRDARALAEEFGTGSPSGDVFGDLQGIDLRLRAGDTDLSEIETVRARARRSERPEIVVLIDAREAEFRLQLGELDRARELLDRAASAAAVTGPFLGDHVRAMIGSTRARLCVALGDPDGARPALDEAYAAGLRTGDLPILSLVAVGVAAVADARGHHDESAVLLGAASRLRGAHDRTDVAVRELSRRARGALGADAFDAAVARGWAMDRTGAIAVVDPGAELADAGRTER